MLLWQSWYVECNRNSKYSVILSLISPNMNFFQWLLGSPNMKFSPPLEAIWTYKAHPSILSLFLLFFWWGNGENLTPFYSNTVINYSCASLYTGNILRYVHITFTNCWAKINKVVRKLFTVCSGNMSLTTNITKYFIAEKRKPVRY